jgi:predicted dehydrogenase
MTSTAVRLGIVGIGNMGSVHARIVLEGRVPGMVLGGLADAEPARCVRFPGVPAFRTSEELIRSGLIDALLIATPHFSHPDVGIAALEAGLHVLVEKPIAVDKAEAERLIAAHRPGSSLVFAAMFNQRTDPRYRRLKALIEEGDLGAIQRINWITTEWFRSDSYYRSGGWRATWAGEGGGVLLNQCPHQLDLWQWLFGMPRSVTATCQFGRFHDIEVEDAVTAVLEYASGVQGVFVATTGEAPGTNRLEVAGEYGKVVIESPARLQLWRNEVSSVEFCRSTPESFAMPACTRTELHVDDTGPQHAGILRNFVRAIAGEEALIAPAAEGLRSVELANAMLLSTWLDTRIELPMDAHTYARELRSRMVASRYRPPSAPLAGSVPLTTAHP